MLVRSLNITQKHLREIKKSVEGIHEKFFRDKRNYRSEIKCLIFKYEIN